MSYNTIAVNSSIVGLLGITGGKYASITCLDILCLCLQISLKGISNVEDAPLVNSKPDVWHFVSMNTMSMLFAAFILNTYL